MEGNELDNCSEHQFLMYIGKYGVALQQSERIHPMQWKIFSSDFNLKRDVKDGNGALYMVVTSQAPGGLQFRADDCSFCFIYIANEILWYFSSLCTFACETVPGS